MDLHLDFTKETFNETNAPLNDVAVALVLNRDFPQWKRALRLGEGGVTHRIFEREQQSSPVSLLARETRMLQMTYCNR